MAGLISSDIRASINSVLVKLHETFVKPITVFKNAERVCISSSPSYNSIYESAGETQSVEYEEVSQTFDARIYFASAINNEFLADAQGTNNKIILPQGSVKIVVGSDAFEFLKEARVVEFDGVTYSIKSLGEHANSTGMFDTIYYSFLLVPLNE